MNVGERRTAMPNVWIESIRVRQPPFEEEGVIQEFVGRGVTQEFDALKRADELGPEKIREAFHDFEDMIGPLRDSFKVQYNLIIRTTPPSAERVAPEQVTRFGEWIRKTRVKATARTFTRVKNPFEPDLIEVSEPTKNLRMSERELGEFWNVTTTVTK